MTSSHTSFLTIRNVRYCLRHWGSQDAPLVVMLHGWMDTSASFQFTVDCFKQKWQVVAPDWRGFGQSGSSGADTYWFPDYLGDLDALLDHLSPASPVRLVGHSMGGNIACLYAGIRPDRIAQLVNIEGFGLPAADPDEAPARYARWLAELKTPVAVPSYESLDGVAARLRKNNPRLGEEQARFLAGHWARQEDGRWRILGDPAHKRSHPILYREAEALACWRRIQAPVLWLEAADALLWKGRAVPDAARSELERRMRHIPQVHRVVIEDAGHMLHHDQPERVAALIEAHFAAGAAPASPCRQRT